MKNKRLGEWQLEFRWSFVVRLLLVAFRILPILVEGHHNILAEHFLVFLVAAPMPYHELRAVVDLPAVIANYTVLFVCSFVGASCVLVVVSV